MFNWFKNKIELKDTKCIISSISLKNGVKSGSEILVPDKFDCLIYTKNRYAYSLSSGKYKMEETHYPKLVGKSKPRHKKIKFIAYYVSSETQHITIRHKKTLYDVLFKICDKLLFTEFLLIHNYKITNAYAINYLAEVFYEVLAYNKFNYTNISSPLAKYGIEIIKFDIQNKKSSIFNNPKKSQIYNSSENKKNLSEIKPKENENNLNDVNTQSTNDNTLQEHKSKSSQTSGANNFYICKNCGNKTKFSTTYCIKCGASLGKGN